MAESKDDLAARKARAARLEAEIAEVANNPGAQPASPVSPREFIQRRMAELNQREKTNRKDSRKK